MENDLIVTTNEQKCEGCNKCIKVCPMPDANIAYSLNDRNKVKIDSKKCIHCGHCIEVCDHGAREYIDDTERFFKELIRGKRSSVLVAPSFRINFKDYKKIFGFFKAIGVNLIFDISFGAEISTWASLKIIKEKNLTSTISQFCPVVVNYIQKYQPELIKVLIPVHSPMICSAIYLKKYGECFDGLAFLSPCISKKDEMNDPSTIGLVDYNITFKRVMEYIEKNKIDLNKYKEKDYDIIGQSLGMIFSKPGGFRENVELYVKDVWIEEIHGQSNVYEYLIEYKKRLINKQPKPNIIDMLNCKMGCNMGTAVEKRISSYDIGYLADKLKKEKIKNGIKDINEAFNSKLNIQDFIREYQDLSEEIVTCKEPSEGEYKAIFNKLHKYTPEDQNVNCFSCGYNSCKTMAKAIHNNINYQSNCIYYNKSELQMEINKNKEVLEELEYIAFNDPLTNIYNRRGIKFKLESIINKARLHNNKVGILFIDLDKFKMINDIFGHDEGDYVLKEVAGRLKEVVGQDGVIGRLGGDEFLAIIDNIYESDEIKKITQNILTIFQKPFQLKNKNIYVTGSLGICIFPDHGNDIETLQKNADISMYKVKENCGNGFQLYNEDITNKFNKQFELLEDIAKGIEKKEFILYYQPKIDVNTSEVIGLEALIRWNHPNKGMIYPNDFISLAEDMGLIEKLDLYVLKSACKQIKEWVSRGIEPTNVSVNISGRLFSDLNFIDKLEHVISKSEIEPYLLSIEITETAAIKNIQYTIEILKKLRRKGIKILLDDFGKGYSSLNYLKELPINMLKIDKSFIDEICNKKVNKAIIQAVINMAKIVKIKVVAEGVETKGQLKILRELECDYYQGYLFSKPIPVEEVEKLLVSNLL